MKIMNVDDDMIRDYDYKKLGRWSREHVLIGTINAGHRTLIQIIGDGGEPFKGEDNFEVVRYTEDELKAREEMRRTRVIWRDGWTPVFDEPDFKLAVVPPSDDPRVLVNWRVFNCKEFQGTAEILCAQRLAHTHREDDACNDVSDKNTLQCLAIFKPGDKLRMVPINPQGMYTHSAGGSFVPCHVYFMHWMTRHGKPHLSVTRRTPESVEKRKFAVLARKVARTT